MGQLLCTKADGADTSRTSGNEEDDQNDVQQVDDFRYLAVGDCYTIGYGVTTIKERWPNILATKLMTKSLKTKQTNKKYKNKTSHNNRHNVIRSIQTTIIARNHYTTNDLLHCIQHEKYNMLELQKPYGLLSICIGYNNQYNHGISVNSLGVYEKELTQIIQYCIKLVANNDPRRIFILSIPDYSYTPFVTTTTSTNNNNTKDAHQERQRRQEQEQRRKTISQEIDRYNSCCERICRKFHIQYIDITKLTRTKRCSKLVTSPPSPTPTTNGNGGGGGNNGSGSGAGGFYPSGEQYKLWVNSFYKQIHPMVVKQEATT